MFYFDTRLLLYALYTFGEFSSRLFKKINKGGPPRERRLVEEVARGQV
jgi:hypothetical protein